jgi:hypothetical protein
MEAVENYVKTYLSNTELLKHSYLGVIFVTNLQELKMYILNWC